MDEERLPPRPHQPPPLDASPKLALPLTSPPSLNAMGDSRSWAEGCSSAHHERDENDDDVVWLEKKKTNESSRPSSSSKRELEDNCFDSQPASKKSRGSPTVYEEENLPIRVKDPSVLALTTENPHPLHETVSEWLETSTPSDKCSLFGARIFPSIEVDEAVHEVNQDFKDVDQKEDQDWDVRSFDGEYPDEYPDDEYLNGEMDDREKSTGVANVGVTSASYRRTNLFENNIVIRNRRQPLPAGIISDHVHGLLNANRSSPGPSMEMLEECADNLIDAAQGCLESSISDAYYNAGIFPKRNDPKFGVRSGLDISTADVPVYSYLVPGGKTGVVTPKPDLLYAYTTGIEEQTFSKLHIATCSQINPKIRDYPNATRHGIAYPFLAVEFKGATSTGGSLWIASNQCAGSVVACLNIIHQLNLRLQEINERNAGYGRAPVPLIENVAYAVAVDCRNATLLIGWMDLTGETPKYIIQEVHDYHASETEQLASFCKNIRNILEWGKTTRRDAICAALEVINRASGNTDPAPPGLAIGTNHQLGDKWDFTPDGSSSSSNASKSRRRSRGGGRGN